MHAAVEFYHQALGLNVARMTDEWAELTCGVGSSSSTVGGGSVAGETFRLGVRAVDSEAQLSTGYSPFLSFNVEDMDSTVARCVQMVRLCAAYSLIFVDRL